MNPTYPHISDPSQKLLDEDPGEATGEGKLVLSYRVERRKAETGTEKRKLRRNPPTTRPRVSNGYSFSGRLESLDSELLLIHYYLNIIGSGS